jgi:hypothetical protein
MKTLILKTQKINPSALAVYALATIAGGAIVLFIVNALIHGIASTVHL